MQLQSNHTRETMIYVSLGKPDTYTMHNRSRIVKQYHNNLPFFSKSFQA